MCNKKAGWEPVQTQRPHQTRVRHKWPSSSNSSSCNVGVWVLHGVKCCLVSHWHIAATFCCLSSGDLILSLRILSLNLLFLLIFLLLLLFPLALPLPPPIPSALPSLLPPLPPPPPHSSRSVVEVEVPSHCVPKAEEQCVRCREGTSRFSALCWFYLLCGNATIATIKQMKKSVMGKAVVHLGHVCCTKQSLPFQGLVPSHGHPFPSPFSPSPASLQPYMLHGKSASEPGCFWDGGERWGWGWDSVSELKGFTLASTIPLLKTRGKNYTGLGAADKQAAGNGRKFLPSPTLCFCKSQLCQCVPNCGCRNPSVGSQPFPCLFPSQTWGQMLSSKPGALPGKWGLQPRSEFSACSSEERHRWGSITITVIITKNHMYP